MENILSEIPGWMAAVIALVSAAATWATTQFERWQSIENKPLKAAVAVGAFLAVAIILSIITAPFT